MAREFDALMGTPIGNDRFRNTTSQPIRNNAGVEAAAIFDLEPENNPGNDPEDPELEQDHGLDQVEQEHPEEEPDPPEGEED